VAGVGEAGEPVQLEGREKLQGEEILKTEAFNLVARNERLKLNVSRSAIVI
jgi:hypothetical protein